MSGSAVRCRGLTKRFGGASGVLAVDGLDLDVPAGSVFGLLGPNGAGKTTTLRLITGPRVADRRRGVDRRHARRSARPGRAAGDRRPRPGPALLRLDDRPRAGRPGRTAAGSRGGRRRDAGRRRARAGRASRTPPTAGSPATRAGCASGSGSPRRSSREPSLLILDEPVSSLDPEGRRDLLALIAELRQRATIIFSTHVLADVERICDRVGILDHGRLVTEGPLDDAPGPVRACRSIASTRSPGRTPGRRAGDAPVRDPLDRARDRDARAVSSSR